MIIMDESGSKRDYLMETRSIWGGDENILEPDRDDGWYLQVSVISVTKTFHNG